MTNWPFARPANIMSCLLISLERQKCRCIAVMKEIIVANIWKLKLDFRQSSHQTKCISEMTESFSRMEQCFGVCDILSYTHTLPDWQPSTIWPKPTDTMHCTRLSKNMLPCTQQETSKFFTSNENKVLSSTFQKNTHKKVLSNKEAFEWKIQLRHVFRFTGLSKPKLCFVFLMQSSSEFSTILCFTSVLWKQDEWKPN